MLIFFVIAHERVASFNVQRNVTGAIIFFALLIIALIALILILIRVYQNETIENKSLKIRELESLNSRYIKKAWSNRHGYRFDSINCKSKAEFDKDHVREISNIAYQNFERIEEALLLYEYNKKLKTDYDKSYSDLLHSPPFTQKLPLVPRDMLIQRENRYLTKNYIAHTFDIEFFIYVDLSYTSPQGRNVYRERLYLHQNLIRELKAAKQLESETGVTFNKYTHPLYGNKIYVFSDIHQPGLCIGQTRLANVEDRIRQEYKNMPTKPWTLLLQTEAIGEKTGTWFTDKDFHRHLSARGYFNYLDHKGSSSEWFAIDVDQVIDELQYFKSIS